MAKTTKRTAKTSRPKDPARPVARHAGVRAFEQEFRWTTHLAKVLTAEGTQAAGDELKRLMDEANYQAERSSMSATGIIELIDTSLFRDETAQGGRSRGGRSTGHNRKENAEKDYEEIRFLATRLLDAGRMPREIIGIISTRTPSSQSVPFSRTKITRALRGHVSGHWKK